MGWEAWKTFPLNLQLPLLSHTYRAPFANFASKQNGVLYMDTQAILLNSHMCLSTGFCVHATSPITISCKCVQYTFHKQHWIIFHTHADHLLTPWLSGSQCSLCRRHCNCLFPSLEWRTHRSSPPPSYLESATWL